MVLALFYLGLGILVVLGLCVFTPAFNWIACAAMAALTGFLAIGHGLTQLLSKLQRAGAGKPRADREPRPGSSRPPRNSA